MFDSLKDKLNRFTNDVDEEVGDEVDESDEGMDDEAPADKSTDGSANDDEVGVGDRVKAAVSGETVIDEDDLEEPLRDLEMYLLQHDVEMSVADEITDGVRDRLVGERRSQLADTSDLAEDALRDAVLDVLRAGEPDFNFLDFIEETDTPVVITFTGVNGVGKTTTIAKVARYLDGAGYSTVIANGDTYRAGANEQVEEHAERLNTKLISHEQGGDPAAVIYEAAEYAEANNVDVVLGDTAGRLHTSDDLMSQLEKIDRVTDPDLTLFVDEAVAGQDAINRAQEFNEAATIDGTILTKADADAEGGAAISVAHVTDEPVVFVGNGQGYDDIVEFHPDVFVDHLFD